MSDIESVIFDLGNVLLPFDWTQAVDRFAARTGRSRREVEDYFVVTPFNHQICVGAITAQEYYRTVSHDLGFDGDYAEFARLYSEIFAPDEDMIALAENLRGRVRRFILSNTNAIHMEYVMAEYPFMHGFEGLVLSHEVGLQKPDPRIYELTLARFGLEAARTVFIDDIPANVEAARAVGLQAIPHRDARQTRQELTKLGVPSI